MTTTIELEVIESTAKELGRQRKELSGDLALAAAELDQVRAKWADVLRPRSQRVAELETQLLDFVDRTPSLFKKPQSLEVDGVRFGVRKGKGSLQLPDQKQLLKRMGRVLTKAQRAAIIKVKVSILKGPLSRLSGDLLKRLGVDVNGAGNEAFVSYPKSNLQKLVDWWMKPIGDDGDDEEEEE